MEGEKEGKLIWLRMPPLYCSILLTCFSDSSPFFKKRDHNYFSNIYLNWKYAILNSTIFGLARLALAVSYLLLTAMNVFHINVSKRNNEIFGVTIQSNSWLKEVIFKKLANNLNIKHDIFNAEIILSYKINNNYF